MGEMFISVGEKLDLCDHCNQQGSVSGGEYTYDVHKQPLLFKCFNCLVKDARRK